MSQPQPQTDSAPALTSTLADGIRTVTLARPARYNTLTSAVIAALVIAPFAAGGTWWVVRRVTA